MSSLCENLHAFAHGELPSEEGDAFREHLASCADCPRGLHAEMMLEALEQTHEPALAAAPGSAGRARPARSTGRVTRALVTGVTFAALAAAASWAFWAHGHRGEGATAMATAPALQSAPTRSTEVRFAYAAADVYRPYDVSRGSGERRHEEVPLAALAALEAKGDWHGLAAELVLAGDDVRAESYLARAPASVDVDADRGAILLDEGRLAEALGVLDAVLAKTPDQPQALFNRAIALRDLELPLAAAEAFDRVVALAEPGWAAEASRQAAALRATYSPSSEKDDP